MNNPRPRKITELRFIVSGPRELENEFRDWINDGSWQIDLASKIGADAHAWRRDGVLTVRMEVRDRDAESLIANLFANWREEDIAFEWGYAREYRTFDFKGQDGTIEVSFTSDDGDEYAGVPGDYQPVSYEDEEEELETKGA